MLEGSYEKKMKISFSSHGIKKISRNPEAIKWGKFSFWCVEKEFVWKMLLPFIFMVEHNMYTCIQNYILHSDKISKVWREQNIIQIHLFQLHQSWFFIFIFIFSSKCIEHVAVIKVMVLGCCSNYVMFTF